MIYLDHAATTPVLPEVLDAMLPWLQGSNVGNPGSIHTQGVKARAAIEKSREQVAKLINADPSEIYFTSGGTESNNSWLQCLYPDYCARLRVITTAVEHHSILEPLDHNGCKILYAKVSKTGMIDLEDLEYMLDDKDQCDGVSVMLVNNELGTINPIKEIGALCQNYGAHFHTDAIQAAGHVPIDVKSCNVDSLSISGHKFGAPLGIGVLYVSNRANKKPLIYGGGQENGMRGGTENVPGIVGIGKAAEIAFERLSRNQKRWEQLREVFLNELEPLNGQYHVNGDPEHRAPNIISLTIPGVHSESLLLLLDQAGIYISAGSACSASSSKVSHVLRGIGMSREDSACTVRISMGHGTDALDMRIAGNCIAGAAQKLKSKFLV